ncbi:MAG: signal peptide peptidase SppA [Hyphomicrobium sp.]
MTLETETVLDRRRLRRSLGLWRGMAIAALALAGGAYAFSGSQKLAELTGGKQIARIAIEGTIFENREQLKLLQKISDAKNVEGVILFVNSPGGTTAGGEALYLALRELAKKKPVVAQFGTVAASAGYIIGLGTDHIVARGNTITGSIGVLMQWPEFSELLGRLGVKYNEVKSGPLKASPSPFAPMDEPSRKVTEDMIQDGFQWFLSLVQDRRGIDPKAVPGLTDGRIFSGRQALSAKLVDEIGGEAEAVRWLEDKRQVAKDLKVVDWKPKADQGGWFGLGFSSLAESVGAGAVAELFGRGRTFPGVGPGLGLDGLVSVWHPQKTQ